MAANSFARSGCARSTIILPSSLVASRLGEVRGKWHDPSTGGWLLRDLTDEELTTLITTTATRDIEHGMSGVDRSMLYLLAAVTGYRRKELRSLTPGNFDLDADPPAIVVTAAYTKARRDDRRPIRRDVAARLRSWLADKPVDAPVFADMPVNTARTLRWDLKAAGIEYEVGGKVFDFHALRGAYISRLERSGASVKTLQTLARHTDPD